MDKIYAFCPIQQQRIECEIINNKEVYCPLCKKNHGISGVNVTTVGQLAELAKNDQILPLFIDKWTYQEKIKGLSISIQGTFFASKVIYIKGNPKWMVQKRSPVFESAGVPVEFYYNGEKIGDTCTASVSEKKGEYVGIRYTDETSFVVAKNILRVTGDRLTYKVSCGKPFVNTFGKFFLATYYKWLITDGKNQKIDLGEKLECELEYLICKGEPMLRVYITNIIAKKDTDLININGEEISLATLKCLADHLGHQQITKKGDNNDKGVMWDQPTGWMDIKDLKNAQTITNAVYMWWGNSKTNDNDYYLYVGIVGANSETNTVCDRIKQEINSGIANEFSIEVKQFRYSMLISSENESFSEILKTVEMQCINNISSIIPVFGNGKETTIKPFLPTLSEKKYGYTFEYLDLGNNKRLILINKSIRYHNG